MENGRMDLIETLRSTGTCARVHRRTVDDACWRACWTPPGRAERRQCQAWRWSWSGFRDPGPACVTSTSGLDRVPGDERRGVAALVAGQRPRRRTRRPGRRRRAGGRRGGAGTGRAPRRGGRCCWRCSPIWRSCPQQSTRPGAVTRSPAARRSTRSRGTFCWPRVRRPGRRAEPRC